MQKYGYTFEEDDDAFTLRRLARFWSVAENTCNPLEIIMLELVLLALPEKEKCFVRTEYACCIPSQLTVRLYDLDVNCSVKAHWTRRNKPRLQHEMSF